MIRIPQTLMLVDSAPLSAESKLTNARGFVNAGLIVLALLVGGIGGWALMTDLAGAVLAPGTVVVASNVKKVQHPTGGVVGEILVKNGDRVKAGELLIKLDETVTRANLQLITSQINELDGRRARLVAERDEAGSVNFPDALKAQAGQASVDQIMRGEQSLFEKRVSTRRSQVQQLGERISGLNEEIAGTTAQVAAKSKEIDLIGKELSSLEGLESRQLVTTSKMMALRREAARLEGERAQLRSSIGQAKGRIAEIEIQRLSVDSEAKSDIIKELRETEGRLAELSERRTAAEDQLKRVEVRSPVDGLVHQMSVSTVGGVVNTVDPIMLIVPDHDEMLIEAKIAPQDIDLARATKTAIVRLTAFDRTSTPTVEGTVLNIAADLTHEERTGFSYYIARVEVPQSELKRIGDVKLVPGMPADVQIVTGSRSAWSYLMKPLEDQFAKAFKER